MNEEDKPETNVMEIWPEWFDKDGRSEYVLCGLWQVGTADNMHREFVVYGPGSRTIGTRHV